MMTEISYIVGDATAPQGTGVKIIMHVCNNKGRWGKGFVLALSKKWRLPEQKFRQSFLSLGDVQIVGVGGNIHVANMVAQDGFGGVAVKYDHLRTCLRKVCECAKMLHASVHGPRIGAGLGGGKWSEIEPLIKQELCAEGIEVTIYDF